MESLYFFFDGDCETAECREENEVLWVNEQFIECRVDSSHKVLFGTPSAITPPFFSLTDSFFLGFS